MKSKSSRSRNLDDDSILVIVRILDGWAGKLTWELLIDEVAGRTRNRYTRQALHSHERVRMAYQLRKTSLAAEPSTRPAKPSEKLSPVEVTKLVERFSRITAENARLQSENDRLLEQFVVWAYNAHTRGLTIEFLSSPLPPIDRELTKTTMSKLSRKK